MDGDGGGTGLGVRALWLPSGCRLDPAARCRAALPAVPSTSVVRLCNMLPTPPAGRLANMLVIAVGICIASYGGAPAAAACCLVQAGAACCGNAPSTLRAVMVQPAPAAAAALFAAARANASLVQRVDHLPCPFPLYACPQPTEINFVLVGVLLQMASVATESTRLTLVQILLQVCDAAAYACGMVWVVMLTAVIVLQHCNRVMWKRAGSTRTLLPLQACPAALTVPGPLNCNSWPQRRGIKLNPITTLYLIAPCCFVFLCVPFVSAPIGCHLV